MVELTQKEFKKGEIIYGSGELTANMYNILLGSAAIYVDYKKPGEQKVLEMHEGDFLNVVSFLEARPRNTTAVALERTVVNEITEENFGRFFREQPAKIISLLQYMSARIRGLQKSYLQALHALEEHADLEELKAAKGEQWFAEHSFLKTALDKLFGSEMIERVGEEDTTTAASIEEFQGK